jgi:hypothetical protein
MRIVTIIVKVRHDDRSALFSASTSDHINRSFTEKVGLAE